MNVVYDGVNRVEPNAFDRSLAIVEALLGEFEMPREQVEARFADPRGRGGT